jgi:hypothetical protein
MELRHFNLSEIILSNEDASAVIRFLWPNELIQPGSITTEDRAFAQALLIEAIDASYKMGFVEQLFKAFFMKVPTSFQSIRGMVKSFAKAAAKHWFKHATGNDLLDPKIYESVRLTLARNFKTTLKIREQTGELIY